MFFEPFWRKSTLVYFDGTYKKIIIQLEIRWMIPLITWSSNLSLGEITIIEILMSLLYSYLYTDTLRRTSNGSYRDGKKYLY